MELSCSLPPGPRIVEYARLAEALGYRRIWLYDSPLLYGDVWVALARVAEATTRLGMGPGVLVPSLRHVAVTAAAVATLEALAPGRVAVAVGTGFTGRRLLGKPPVKWARVETFVRALRALLRGEIAEVEDRPLRMLHPEGFAAPRPIAAPVLIAANGPVGLGVAKALGDGVMSIGDPPAGFDWCAVMRSGTVLEAGETLGSPRVFEALAPAIALVYHATYQSAGAAVDQLPGGRAWRQSILGFPAAERHLHVHEGHLVEVPARERPLLDPRVGAMTFTGTPEQLRARRAELEAAGATELVYSPTGPDIPRELRTMAAL